MCEERTALELVAGTVEESRKRPRLLLLLLLGHHGNRASAVHRDRVLDGDGAVDDNGKGGGNGDEGEHYSPAHTHASSNARVNLSAPAGAAAITQGMSRLTTQSEE